MEASLPSNSKLLIVLLFPTLTLPFTSTIKCESLEGKKGFEETLQDAQLDYKLHPREDSRSLKYVCSLVRHLSKHKHLSQREASQGAPRVDYNVSHTDIQRNP